jgi:hypothetical protein
MPVYPPHKWDGNELPCIFPFIAVGFSQRIPCRCVLALAKLLILGDLKIEKVKTGFRSLASVDCGVRHGSRKGFYNLKSNFSVTINGCSCSALQLLAFPTRFSHARFGVSSAIRFISERLN